MDYPVLVDKVSGTVISAYNEYSGNLGINLVRASLVFRQDGNGKKEVEVLFPAEQSYVGRHLTFELYVTSQVERFFGMNQSFNPKQFRKSSLEQRLLDDGGKVLVRSRYEIPSDVLEKK